VRDAMPPMEDLVVGGHPGPIGASSAIAVIMADYSCSIAG